MTCWQEMYKEKFKSPDDAVNLINNGEAMLVEF